MQLKTSEKCKTLDISEIEVTKCILKTSTFHGNLTCMISHIDNSSVLCIVRSVLKNLIRFPVSMHIMIFRFQCVDLYSDMA